MPTARNGPQPPPPQLDEGRCTASALHGVTLSSLAGLLLQPDPLAQLLGGLGCHPAPALLGGPAGRRPAVSRP
eukprot:10361909-Lingulodinium_polyedra.AAC.1